MKTKNKHKNKTAKKRQNTQKRPAARAVRRRESKGAGIAWTVGLWVLLGISFLGFFAGLWYIGTYGDLGFDSVIFTLFSSMGGVQAGLIRDFLLEALLPALVCTGIVGILLFKPIRKKLYLGGARVYPLSRWGSRITALVLSLFLLAFAAVDTGLGEYLYGQFQETEIFEKRYVDPDSVEIRFPEKKRNLIYIFLESMETTYFSEAEGGAVDVNLIPELYALAEENLNFSQNKGVGGILPVNGTTWTIGAMVGQTAGVPLKTPDDVDDWQNGYGEEGVFLPGITNLLDILDENGYNQALMVGSVASFGGRKTYYQTHGTDTVYELTTARQAGIVPADYFVWWGMEDKYLFEYAKQELTSMAQQEEPFAFTMLTVDSHHIGGYFCEYCQDVREEQYENVMSCSSRQVAAFVEWIQAQSFYENTTVIIAGDHPSMDNGYFERSIDDSYTRRMYNCFINTPVTTQYNKNRQFCTLDMFPTTLAALGCTIQGDRLGLGTNLFSGTPTLIEAMGYQHFNDQIAMSSDYYAEQFRLEVPEEENEDPEG